VVGDAAGYVDALTGEGLGLAFGTVERWWIASSRAGWAITTGGGVN
jgi:hypothetical protein